MTATVFCQEQQIWINCLSKNWMSAQAQISCEETVVLIVQKLESLA